MTTFSYDTEFFVFRSRVTNSSRYILSDEVLKFLKAVSETAKSREFILAQGTELFRSVRATKREEVSNEPFHYYPCDNSRCYPLTNKAHEGRANPKGIPYLYTAVIAEVAVAEVRPVPGEPFTLVKLQTDSDLRLVDCTRDNNSYGSVIPSDPAETARIDSIVWSHINDAFSVPTSNNVDSADYVPTQIIAEKLRLLGYDGIRYASQFCRDRPGINHNIVLFVPSKAKIIDKTVIYIDEVIYRYTPLGKDVPEWDIITRNMKARQCAS